MGLYRIDIKRLRDENRSGLWADGETLFCGGMKDKTAVCITDLPLEGIRLAHSGMCVIMYLTPQNRSMDFGGIKYAVESLEGIDEEYLERVYLRFMKKPWTILKTERLLVRETEPDDVEAVYSIYADPEVIRYTEAPTPHPAEEREYLTLYTEHVYAFWGFGIWLVTELESGQAVGRAGFSYREGMDMPEMGFVIAAPWQRRGYAYEVCTALLEYGRIHLEFDQVQALVMKENHASRALCDKLGFLCYGESLIEGTNYLRYVYTF